MLSRKRPLAAISESAPQAKKRRVSVKKSVCFNQCTQVVVVEASSVVEGSSSWYEHGDYANFKQNMKRDVFYMARLCQQRSADIKVEADLEEYCYVGLEKYCCPKADREESRSLKQQRTRAVLEMQQCQKMHGQTDLEHIREVATMFSKRAVEKALQ
jgi:hypothetical protein